MEMTEDEQKFQNVIKAKLATLNGRVEGKCKICGELVKVWGVCIPENDADALGFGCKDKNTARVAFFPACAIHDMEDAENIEKVIQMLIMKKITISN